MWFKNPNKLSAGGNSDVVVHETKKDPDKPGSPPAENTLPVDPPIKPEMGPGQRTSGDGHSPSGVAEVNTVKVSAAPSPLPAVPVLAEPQPNEKTTVEQTAGSGEARESNAEPSNAVDSRGGGQSLLDEFLAEEARDKRIAEELAEKPVFTTGEVLLIRGGFFKVSHLTEKRMYLDFQGEAGEILKAQQ